MAFHGNVFEGLLLEPIVSLLFTVLPLISVRFRAPRNGPSRRLPPLTEFFSKTKVGDRSLDCFVPGTAASYQPKLVTGVFSLCIGGGLGFLALVAIATFVPVRNIFLRMQVSCSEILSNFSGRIIKPRTPECPLDLCI